MSSALVLGCVSGSSVFNVRFCVLGLGVFMTLCICLILLRIWVCAGASLCVCACLCVCVSLSYCEREGTQHSLESKDICQAC